MESIISIAVLRSICLQAEIHPTSVRVLGVTGHKWPLLVVKCSNNTGGMNVQPVKLEVDGEPIFLKRLVIPYGHCDGVLQALEKMERDGIITQVTSSAWARPIVIAIKLTAKHCEFMAITA
ncbi:unnamed protein product [Echinostoma caproni]|uniref:Reverse transcriptase n=1 Tax=Echinostoma caproni TaxID=27848 RepID=A0A183A270_9TREM|nr:unnamed protein product [Echinostoma caproni]